MGAYIVIFSMFICASAARLVAGVVLAGLGLAAGAVLVGASVVIVPGYGIFRLRRHLQLRKMLKGNKSRPAVDRFTERDITRGKN